MGIVSGIMGIMMAIISTSPGRLALLGGVGAGTRRHSASAGPAAGGSTAEQQGRVCGRRDGSPRSPGIVLNYSGTA